MPQKPIDQRLRFKNEKKISNEENTFDLGRSRSAPSVRRFIPDHRLC
jgi:hypothetical protein